MRSLMMVTASILFIAAPAAAQSMSQNSQRTQAVTADSSNPAVKDSDAQTTPMAAEGANSFTESQARERMAKAGYRVSTLTKDADGVWTGKARRGGKSLTVGLDYKGNVSTR